MKPRPADVPAPDAPLLRRWCGIDPGQRVGMVALSVANTGPEAFDVDRARFIGATSLAASTSKAYTNAGARGTLLLRVRQQLVDWAVTDVVLEENSDVTNVWIGADGQKVRGQGTGTAFYQGAHYGLCLGATVTLPWPVHVWSYPPTTPTRTKRLDEGEPVRGWMQGFGGRIPPRMQTLTQCGYILRAVKQRPVNGSIPGRDELDREHSEHERMAAGVLAYHLQRERGRLRPSWAK